MQEEKKGSGSQGSQAVFALASPGFERQPRQRVRRGFERTETVRHPPSCTRRIQTGGAQTHTRPFSSTSRAHGLSSFFCEVKSHGGILAIPKKVDGQHLSEKLSHVRTYMNDLWKCIKRDHLPGPSRYG